MFDHASSPCVLFALDRESTPFRRLFLGQERLRKAPCRAWSCSKSGRSLWIVETGVGPAKTQGVLDWLIRAGSVSDGPLGPLIMAGFAGSLQADVCVGDIVIAQEIVDLDGYCWPTSWPSLTLPARTLPARTGRVLTAPRLIGDPDEKRRLGQTHHAQAVDMESATVARFCHEHSIPFGCVRSISDNMDTFLPAHLVSLLSQGQVSVPRLLATLAWHPGTIGSLMKLARNTRLAANALAKTLAELLSI